MRLASGCICGRRLLQDENEGTCLICGHGWPHDPVHRSLEEPERPAEFENVRQA